MLTIDQLKKLITERESQTLEFKKSTAQLCAAMETVVGFLNRQGGIVLLGVSDNGEILGQIISDRTRQELAREFNKIEPSALKQIRVSNILVKDNKQVIVIEVESGRYAPYVYDGRPFQRNQSTTSRMSQHHYEQIIVQRGQLDHSWDSQATDEYGIESLDENEIYLTVADAIQCERIPAISQKEDISTILKRLDLLQGSKLKHAAIVLFGKKEAMTLGRNMIKMARFRGTDKISGFIDNQQVLGNAFTLLSEAESFLHRHLPIESTLINNQFQRRDRLAIPFLALREAIINAICHREYVDFSTEISLAIYDDRIEIWNSGSLPRDMTVNDLKHRHESHPRNRLIANVFYLRKYVEKWGTGTNQMINLCQEDGLRDPEFIEEWGGLSVFFYFKEPMQTLHKKGHENLNDRQKEILRVLQLEGSIGVSAILPKSKLFTSLRTLNRDLVELRNFGFIETFGKGSKKIWKLQP